MGSGSHHRSYRCWRLYFPCLGLVGTKMPVPLGPFQGESDFPENARALLIIQLLKDRGVWAGLCVALCLNMGKSLYPGQLQDPH